MGIQHDGNRLWGALLLSKRVLMLRQMKGVTALWHQQDETTWPREGHQSLSKWQWTRSQVIPSIDTAVRARRANMPRCSRVRAVETRGDKRCQMAFGLFPFRRSLKPHLLWRPRCHIEIENGKKQNSRTESNTSRNVKIIAVKFRTALKCFILLCSFCYLGDMGSWKPLKKL